MRLNDFAKSTSTNGTIYLRVRRQGTTWTSFTSKDGNTWTQRYQFSNTLVPAMVGIHAGNCCGTESAAFTVLVDYFSNSLAPLATEDGQTTARPSLGAARAGGNLVITWPGSATGFTLEASASLGNPNWVAVTQTVTSASGQNTVTIPISSGTLFYRLKK